MILATMPRASSALEIRDIKAMIVTKTNRKSSRIVMEMEHAKTGQRFSLSCSLMKNTRKDIRRYIRAKL